MAEGGNTLPHSSNSVTLLTGEVSLPIRDATRAKQARHAVDETGSVGRTWTNGSFILILLLFGNLYCLGGELPEKGGGIEEFFTVVEGDHNAVIYNVGLFYQGHLVVIHR